MVRLSTGSGENMLMLMLSLCVVHSLELGRIHPLALPRLGLALAARHDVPVMAGLQIGAMWRWQSAYTVAMGYVMATDWTNVGRRPSTINM